METRTSPRDYWRLLANYLKPLRNRVLLLAALVLLSVALQLASPLVLRYFIDEALAGEPLRTLFIIAGVYIAFALLIQASRLLETWSSEYVGLTATNELRADLADHVLGLDIAFHNRHTPGNLIERVDGDIGILANFFSKFILNVLANVLLTLGVIMLLLRIDWRIGLVVALFAVITLGTLMGFGRFVSSRFVASRQASADMMGFLEERISGTEDIRSAGANAYVMRRNHEHARNLYETSNRAMRLSAISFSTSTMLGVLGTTLALVIATLRFQDGAITVGTVFVVFQYTQLITHPLDEIARQMRDFQQASASISRIRQLQSETSTITDGPGAIIPPGALSVAVDHVTFTYDDDTEPTLRDVSFTLPAERVLGIVGRTGSGKSTITKALVRFIDPNEGAVRLGGVDLRDCTLNDLRNRISLVTQEVQLFRASVRENLTLFDDTIPDNRIVASLRQLGLGEWYDSLPEGLDTMLSSGSSMSAGEAQILALTRVFLRDPDVIILDEASSRLDPSTEARLEHAIDTLLQGRTAIIIAHRLATIERAHDVLVLSGGKVVEHGKRVDLVADPSSHFAGLLRTGHDLIASGEVPA